MCNKRVTFGERMKEIVLGYYLSSIVKIKREIETDRQKDRDRQTER